ncbi:uncharacterized protein [Drosophila kikkawai]|uniref:Uncharacterized protein isoform X2 n=1 Tax=Drosophila kikkawai TaxID=30033 RepID=A0ABM4GR56_DROKI
MLEPHRRSQLMWEPIDPIPTTRTTTTRRTRRLCLNIETNGAGPPRSRRRRRSMLPDPYYITYPPGYEANPWIYDNWGSNENLYSYGDFVTPLNRLYAGGEYEYAPDYGFIPPQEESAQKIYSDRTAVGGLKNILMGLEGFFKEENKMEPENNVEPKSTGASENQNPQNHQLSVLTDVLCDTIGRLNNSLTAMSRNHEHMEIHNLRPLPRVPPPVQVLQLPVQPLILPPRLPSSTSHSNCPYFIQPEFYPSESKTHYGRLPLLKEKKRKRPSKCVTHVRLQRRLQSQSCSTDDLDVLPRILEASNSRLSRVPMASLSPTTKDVCTTMFCPMKSRECRTLKQENPSEDLVIPSSMTITDRFPPSVLEAPPPSMKSEDDLARDHEMDLYHPPSKSIHQAGISPQRSSSSSSCNYHRLSGGSLMYSYVEEEKEEQLQVETEEEHVEEDEWYRGASYKLAQLELEQEYFEEMQKQSIVFTRDQEQQTDQDIASVNSSVNIRVTTDKAVSTTDISGLTSREPVKIVRIYKKSSLKPRHRLTSNNPKGKSKGIQCLVRILQGPLTGIFQIALIVPQIPRQNGLIEIRHISLIHQS